MFFYFIFFCLSNDFLLAVNGAEEAVLNSHEAFSHQALGAARAPEALGLGVPIVVSVRNSLSLGFDGSLTRRAFLRQTKMRGVKIWIS